jgi:hypothetical protein
MEPKRSTDTYLVKLEDLINGLGLPWPDEGHPLSYRISFGPELFDSEGNSLAFSPELLVEITVQHDHAFPGHVRQQYLSAQWWERPTPPKLKD